MCLLVRIVRAFLHTAPDALFPASFVSSLKFTQFHCKQIRVFPLWFSVSAVFRSSCVHIRFFCGCTMLSLSDTLGLLYLVHPWCVPIYSIFNLSICSAICNPVFLDVPMLSLLPRQLVKNRLGNKPTRYADFHEKTAELLLKLHRKPEHVIYSVGGKWRLQTAYRGTSLQTVDFFLKLNRLTYYSSIPVNYNRKQANLSDIQANRSVECHYEWPLLPGL